MKPVVIEIFADNGLHSHWALIDPKDGKKIWSESPEECKALGHPVESPSDSEAVDTESPVQYGTAFEADCEHGTWTFKMDKPFYVMAGRFKIIPLKK